MPNVSVTGGELSEEEIDTYVKRVKEQYPHKHLTAIEFEVDGEYVNCTYHFKNPPFQRIRRITGYLVGTLDRFNNAKRAEESQRLKHSAVRYEANG